MAGILCFKASVGRGVSGVVRGSDLIPCSVVRLPLVSVSGVTPAETPRMRLSFLTGWFFNEIMCVLCIMQSS